MQINLRLTRLDVEQAIFGIASSEILVLLVFLFIIFGSDDHAFDYNVDMGLMLLLKTRVEVDLAFLLFFIG